MEKKRYYIATQGNDDEAYREAMAFACQLANKDPEIEKVILLAHSKQNTGWLERLYGEGTVKNLFNGTRFRDCKPLFKIETLRTYKQGYTKDEVVITLALDSEEVLKIDNHRSVKVIIAIPWSTEGIAKWVQTWNPFELRGKQDIVTVYQVPSCLARKAMEELTATINMTTGIHHPMDEDRAKTYIKALHKYEPELNADVIGSYLVRELKWQTRHAKDVEKLIHTLNSGKYFQGGQKVGLQNHYKRWKEDCKEEQREKK
jgi:hypothetical protein